MSHIAQLSLLNVYAFLQVASLDASLTPLVPDGGGLLLSLFLSSLSLSLFLSLSPAIQPLVQLKWNDTYWTTLNAMLYSSLAENLPASKKC